MLKTTSIGIILTLILSIFLFQGWHLFFVIAALLMIWVMAAYSWLCKHAEDVLYFLNDYRTEI